jgi:8-oxo-dGTP pyrophosphatase MutT (NUDIX family)
MDYSSGNGCLIDNGIPDKVLEGLILKLNDINEVIGTFKEIEKRHWDYLDNYRDQNRRKYPGYKIHEFSKKIFMINGITERSIEINKWLRLYNKHKKSLPTAGVIMFHDTKEGLSSGSNIAFITIRMKHTDIWSMPKGKKDPEDMTLTKTATREFCEETGIDLDDCVSITTPSKVINKTRFYLVESDDKNNNFSGYNTNEIGDVKWTFISDIFQCSRKYSKQTVATAKYLHNIYN